jgi:hypothetical protein
MYSNTVKINRLCVLYVAKCKGYALLNVGLLYPKQVGGAWLSVQNTDCVLFIILPYYSE